MIPEPHPYDPDDPTYDEATDDLGYASRDLAARCVDSLLLTLQESAS